MTNNIRVFLWLAVALALWLNYSQWQIDYGAEAGRDCHRRSGDWQPGAPKPSDIADAVPQVAQPAADAPVASDAVPRRRRPSRRPPAPISRRAKTSKIRVTTDVLVLDISLTGGTLVRAELPGYPIVKGEAAPVVLFNTDDAVH